MQKLYRSSAIGVCSWSGCLCPMQWGTEWQENWQQRSQQQRREQRQKRWHQRLLVQSLAVQLLLGQLAVVYAHWAPVWRPSGPWVTTLGWTTCAVSPQGNMGCFDSGTDDGGESPQPGHLYQVPIGLVSSGNIRTASVLSHGRRNWLYVANRVCTLNFDDEVHCLLVNGTGPQGVSSFTQDLTDSLLPPEAATDIAQMCTSANYLCALTNQGRLLCGSTALEAASQPASGAGAVPDQAPPGPASHGGTIERGRHRLVVYGPPTDRLSLFVSQGPFLDVGNVSFVACGEQQVCAIGSERHEEDLGDDSEDLDDDDHSHTHSSGHEWEGEHTTTGARRAGDMHCWRLRYAGDEEVLEFTHEPVVEAVEETQLPPGPADLHMVQHVSTSYSITCAITSDQALLCWSLDEQLDEAGEAPPPPPEAVVPSQLQSNVIDVVVDGHYGIVCTRSQNRDLQCFDPKSGALYSLPDAATRDVSFVHVREGMLCSVSTLLDLTCFYVPLDTDPMVPPEHRTEVSRVAVGAYHTCLTHTLGDLHCYGYNDYGQTDVPEDLLTANVTSIALGSYHSCATTNASELYCFGMGVDDNYGSHMAIPEGFETDVAQVSAGTWHTCAVRNDGRMACWGGYSENGTTQDVHVPEEYREGVAYVSAGGNHTCIITVDRDLRCWGDNSDNQTGPIPAGFHTRVATVSAGMRHTCIVDEENHLACFGWNHFGQSNVLSGFSSGIGDVVAGYGHTCAITSTRNLRCFGGPPDAQLADNIQADVALVSTSRDRVCYVAMDAQLVCEMVAYFAPMPLGFGNLAEVDVIHAAQNLLWYDPRNPNKTVPWG